MMVWTQVPLPFTYQTAPYRTGSGKNAFVLVFGYGTVWFSSDISYAGTLRSALRECCHGNVTPPAHERAHFGNISQHSNISSLSSLTLLLNNKQKTLQ